MCGIVYLVDQEKELGSPQELQDAFSRDVTDYAADGYEAAGISMNSCLCQINTERYLTDAGATFDAPDEWDDIYVTATTNYHGPCHAGRGTDQRGRRGKKMMNSLELEERREELKALVGGSLYIPNALGTSDLTNVLESVSDAPYKICTVVWSDGDRMNYYLWEVEPRRINSLTIQHNPRGFAYVEFRDLYGAVCSLQKSSLASDDAIWIGVDDAAPKIMRSQAEAHGIDVGTGPESRNGWIDYPLPKEVLLTTRMHLNREQVIELLPFLRRFAETGEIQ